MRVLQIATVGDDIEPVLTGIREMPVSRLILLTLDQDAEPVKDLRTRLAGLNLPVDVHEIHGDILLGVMRLVSDIVREESLAFDDLYLNVSSGSKMLTCAGISAAFVNGIKAIGTNDRGIFHLPVLKFSYSELISEAKFRILRALQEMGGEAESLDALKTPLKVDKSLLSYHIRGGRESKGLEGLGLVSVDRSQYGKLRIRLTELGRVILSGRFVEDESSRAGEPAPT